MKEKIKWGALITALLIPLAVGGVAALLTRENMVVFEYVRKPPLSPPAWLFPVAWTALYILMGIASYLIYVSPATKPRKERALTVYALQLLLNFFWPVVFFNLEMYLAAFMLLVLLIAAIALCILLFEHIDSRASKLLIPYLLWCCFAAYLNLGIYLLN